MFICIQQCNSTVTTTFYFAEIKRCTLFFVTDAKITKISFWLLKYVLFFSRFNRFSIPFARRSIVKKMRSRLKRFKHAF